jgi:hypothetical protein
MSLSICLYVGVLICVRWGVLWDNAPVTGSSVWGVVCLFGGFPLVVALLLSTY